MQLDQIYGGLESIPVDINSSNRVGGQIIYVAFFPDGRVLWALPPEGLNGDLPPSQNGIWKDDWGRYTVNGDTVRISFPNDGPLIGTWDGDRLRFAHSRISNRQVSLIPWPRLSGRALEGMYEVAPGYPGIRFASDGRFYDNGFQTMLGTISTSKGDILAPESLGESARRRPGAGTFSLANYTLELRYVDGRVVRLPLMIAPNTADQLPVSSFEVFGQTFKRL